jgi:hypothetical protein
VLTLPHPPLAATGLGDLLVATLLRGCLVMLPMLGLSATLPWLAAATTVVAAMTGWLTAKAVLLYQLADGNVFQVQDTGVTLHLPIVLAAEVLGAFMAWFLLVLVWVNRRVMMQPAAGDPIISLTRTAAAMQQQRMAVQQWISQQEPAGEGPGEGPDLTAPLLDGAAAAEAGQAGFVVEDDAASFLSARLRQLSNSSWTTAESSPGGTAPLLGSLQATGSSGMQQQQQPGNS